MAAITIVPPTIVALATWRHVRANGRGSIHDQLGRLEDKLDGHITWHLERST